MNIRITFKTPDALDVVDEQLTDHCEDHDKYTFTCDNCCEARQEAAYDAQSIKDKLGKFVKYGEYITVEFDIAKGTAKVIPVK